MNKEIESGCTNNVLIRTVPLGNNLTLELYDTSKKIMGDRWLVSLEAKIDIPIDNLVLGNGGDSGSNIIEIRKALGKSVCFRQSRARNFIADTEKETTLQDLVGSFLITASSYLSHKDFPKKFIAKEYEKYLKMKSWCTDHENLYVDGI